ncbi:MAG: hypothetical protein ACIAQF_11025 [Phycisphaerales bacterium JB065]
MKTENRSVDLIIPYDRNPRKNDHAFYNTNDVFTRLAASSVPM